MPSGIIYSVLSKAERVKVAKQMDQMVKLLQKNTKHVETMAKQMEGLVRALTGGSPGK